MVCIACWATWVRLHTCITPLQVLHGATLDSTTVVYPRACPQRDTTPGVRLLSQGSTTLNMAQQRAGLTVSLPVAACPPSVTTSSVATARGTARDQGQEQGTAAVRAAVSSSLLIGVMVGIMQVRRQQGVAWAAAGVAERLPGEVARTSRVAAAWLAVGFVAFCESSCSRGRHGGVVGPAAGVCGVVWLLMSVKDTVCVPILTCSVSEQALPQRPVPISRCTWVAHMLAMPRASLDWCAVCVTVAAVYAADAGWQQGGCAVGPATGVSPARPCPGVPVGAGAGGTRHGAAAGAAGEGGASRQSCPGQAPCSLFS